MIFLALVNTALTARWTSSMFFHVVLIEISKGVTVGFGLLATRAAVEGCFIVT